MAANTGIPIDNTNFVSWNHFIAFTFAITFRLSNHKLHIPEEVAFEHKLSSFSHSGYIVVFQFACTVAILFSLFGALEENSTEIRKELTMVTNVLCIHMLCIMYVTNILCIYHEVYFNQIPWSRSCLSQTLSNEWKPVAPLECRNLVLLTFPIERRRINELSGTRSDYSFQ